MQHKRYRENNEPTKPLQAKTGNILRSSDIKNGKSISTPTIDTHRKPQVSNQGQKLEFYDKTNKFEHPTYTITRAHKNYRRKPKTRKHAKETVKIIPIVSNKKFKERSLKFEDFDQPPDSTSTPVTNHIRESNYSSKEDSINNNKNRYTHILHGHILNEAPEPFKNWDINSIKGSETHHPGLQEAHRTTAQTHHYQLTFKDRQVLDNWDKMSLELQEHEFATNYPHCLYKTATTFCSSNKISSNEGSCDNDSTGYQSSGGNATYNNSNE